MKIGFIILGHHNLDRVAQLAQHMAEQGCPSCIHIDKNTPDFEYNMLTKEVAEYSNVIFSPRTACEWGRFSIVKATLDAADDLLKQFPDLDYVFLISGSCLPIRPIRQLKKFLQRNSHTDFIESVSVRNNFWVKGGLNEERFTLYFPFSWRNRRWLFDKSVDLQRKLKIERNVPDGLMPHIGSQWWCLTSKTLHKILDDPRRPYYDRYFSRAWIPDESYFQTLARKHAKKIESRSLTFSKFDFTGKPFTFYDDHLEVLPLSDCFMGRKVWSGADGLYKELLNPDRPNQPMTKADPKAIAEMLEETDKTRCEGGEGRVHPGRFPLGQSKLAGVSLNEYSVFVGFKDLYEHFPEWVQQNTTAHAHGSIFDRRKIAHRKPTAHFAGNLPAEPAVRNRNSKGYLANFLWDNREKHQSFLYDFRDRADVVGTIAYDPKATIVVIRHSWLLLLLNRKASFARILATAKRFHKIEQSVLDEFSETVGGATVKVLDLDAAVHSSASLLSEAIDHIANHPNGYLKAMPILRNLDGLDAFVRKLRNNGLKIQFEHERKMKEKTMPNMDGFTKPYAVK